MDKIHSESTDRLFEAILTLKDQKECYAFFEDICTIKELQDLAQRFDVAARLSEGANYNQVSAATGASSATISRVNRCLLYGNGGYQKVLERTKGEKQ